MKQQILLNGISEEEFFAKVQKVVRKELRDLQPEKKSKNDELITSEDVCKMLGICRATLHKWRKDGLLKFYRIGRKVRFKKNEVLESLNKIEKINGRFYHE